MWQAPAVRHFPTIVALALGLLSLAAAAPENDIERLRERGLLLPVQGIDAAGLRESFKDRRSGRRSHQAIDIMARRRTPVLATDDGRVEKLMRSRSGGITIYQFDPEGEYCFMYAHLDAYVKGLHEGQEVQRGDVIGYVGFTGNAKKSAPHLHFAIHRLDDTKRWWKGKAVDPFLLWNDDADTKR